MEEFNRSFFDKLADIFEKYEKKDDLSNEGIDLVNSRTPEILEEIKPIRKRKQLKVINSFFSGEEAEREIGKQTLKNKKLQNESFLKEKFKNEFIDDDAVKNKEFGREKLKRVSLDDKKPHVKNYNKKISNTQKYNIKNRENKKIIDENSENENSKSEKNENQSRKQKISSPKCLRDNEYNYLPSEIRFLKRKRLCRGNLIHEKNDNFDQIFEKKCVLTKKFAKIYNKLIKK